jgi:hypothetical protein
LINLVEETIQTGIPDLGRADFKSLALKCCEFGNNMERLILPCENLKSLLQNVDGSLQVQHFV